MKMRSYRMEWTRCPVVARVAVAIGLAAVCGGLCSCRRAEKAQPAATAETVPPPPAPQIAEPQKIADETVEPVASVKTSDETAMGSSSAASEPERVPESIVPAVAPTEIEPVPSPAQTDPVSAAPAASPEILVPATPAAAPASAELAPGETVVAVSTPWNSNSWYRANWSKRSPVVIESGSVEAGNYAVKVAVAFDPNMKADFSDLRFTGQDGVTELPYALETVENGKEAVARVLVPSLSQAHPTMIYAYFGNSEAAGAADAALLSGFAPVAQEPEGRLSGAMDRDVAYVVVPAPDVLARSMTNAMSPPPELPPAEQSGEISP